MSKIKDINGHLVCRVNASTGYVEAAYKKQVTSANLAVGESFRIERDNAVTIVTRDTATTFQIQRYSTAA